MSQEQDQDGKAEVETLPDVEVNRDWNFISSLLRHKTSPLVNGDATSDENVLERSGTVQAESSLAESSLAESSLIEGKNFEPVPDVSEPAQGQTIIDPVYGTAVTRITDHENDPSSGFARSYYSRIQAFNADESRVMTHAEDGYWHLYDPETSTHIKKLQGPAGAAEVQWDVDNPDIIYFVGTNGVDNEFYQMNVVTDEMVKLADFDGRVPWDNLFASRSRYEGSPSEDGEKWAFMAQDDSWNTLGIFVWDKSTDKILSTFDFAEHGIAEGPDYVSMSPSGEYVIASWSHESGLGTRAYTKDFSSFVQLHHGSEHSDLVKLANGHDAFVSIDYQANGGSVFYIDIQTGEKVDLFPSYLNGSVTAMHFSGRAFDKPGWVLISTYDENKASEWLHQKIFAVELTENPRIFNIANHHSMEGGYWTEPQATVNKDFTKILFNSNWGNGSSTDIDTYMVELKDYDIPELALSGDIVGTNQDDILIGTEQDDIIDGLAGNDTIDGKGGDDVITGGLGADTINGGDGIDTVDYSEATTGITVDLYWGSGEQGVAEGDQYTSVENIIGGNSEAYTDHLFGNDESNHIQGLAGRDNIEGGKGADIIDGGDQEDYAKYRYSETGVDVALTRETQIGGDAEGDVLINIENLSGSSHDDKLTGDEGRNQLDGNEGDDILSGLAGDDTILGGMGNDIIYGGEGNDSLHGQCGADVFVFEAASAFSGVDKIYDFSVEEGDILDISDLLIDYDPLDSNVEDFVRITDDGVSSILSVDVNGSGQDFIEIATFVYQADLMDETALAMSGNLVLV